jgi:HEPN domain-containing protein
MSVDVAESLLRLAQEDLDTARVALAPSPRNAAFHVQQAAEKLVKAVLVRSGIHPPRTHDILLLAELLEEAHPWRAPLVALDALTPAAVAYRYPSPTGELPDAPEPAEILGAIGDVQSAGREGAGIPVTVVLRRETRSTRRLGPP